MAILYRRSACFTPRPPFLITGKDKMYSIKSILLKETINAIKYKCTLYYGWIFTLVCIIYLSVFHLINYTWWFFVFMRSFYVSFSKLSDPLEEAMRSKYSLSIPWHKSVRFLYCRTMLANLLSGRGVVSIVKICPKTSASNSVGLENIIYMNILWKSYNKIHLS